MPNWCDNSVEITGPSTMIDRLVQEAEKQNMLNFVVPEPVDNENWYWWRIGAWGTKWDIAPEDISMMTAVPVEKGLKRLSMDFMSAWSPPVPIYRKLQAEYDCAVLAYYLEPGEAFCGKYEDGADIDIDLTKDIEEIRQTIPDDLDEHFQIVEMLEEEKEQ